MLMDKKGGTVKESRITVKYKGIIIGDCEAKGQFEAPATMVGYVKMGTFKPFISIGSLQRLLNEYLTRQIGAKASAIIDLEASVEGTDFITVVPVKYKNGLGAIPPVNDSFNVAVKASDEKKEDHSHLPYKEQLEALLKIPEEDRTQDEWRRIKIFRARLKKEQEAQEEKETKDPKELERRKRIAQASEDRAYREFTGNIYRR